MSKPNQYGEAAQDAVNRTKSPAITNLVVGIIGFISFIALNIAGGGYVASAAWSIVAVIANIIAGLIALLGSPVEGTFSGVSVVSIIAAVINGISVVIFLIIMSINGAIFESSDENPTPVYYAFCAIFLTVQITTMTFSIMLAIFASSARTAIVNDRMTKPAVPAPPMMAIPITVQTAQLANSAPPAYKVQAAKIADAV